MIPFEYSWVILTALVTVPMSWAVPQAYAFDAVAAWTAAVLALFSPPTALWLAVIATGLPLALRAGESRRGLITGLICASLLGGLILSRAIPTWAWIGGAFFTLRALHVTLEWWMERMKAPSVRDSLHYLFYLPVVAAGPINRFPHFQHQLRRRRWDWAQICTGMERLLLGLIWFFVLSGFVMARVTSRAETELAALPEFLRLWGLSVLSWIDLFLAFAGSAHIALGIALMSGLQLEENFDRPWAARNLLEFWTRWHMTLTQWVRDYVFQPVMVLTRKPAISLIAAMLAVGLWHAFSIYYVLWAFWQSLGIILTRLAVGGVEHFELPRFLSALWILGWLSAARPVIDLLGVSP